MEKVYLCDLDKDNLDYIFTKKVIEENGFLLSSLEDADICLFNAGVFLSKHNAVPMEEELYRAKQEKKKIIVIKPYGTSYLPLAFRKLKLSGIELLATHIEAALKDKPLNEADLLLNRYC